MYRAKSTVTRLGLPAVMIVLVHMEVMVVGLVYLGDDRDVVVRNHRFRHIVDRLHGLVDVGEHRFLHIMGGDDRCLHVVQFGNLLVRHMIVISMVSMVVTSALNRGEAESKEDHAAENRAISHVGTVVTEHRKQ